MSSLFITLDLPLPLFLILPSFLFLSFPLSFYSLYFYSVIFISDLTYSVLVLPFKFYSPFLISFQQVLLDPCDNNKNFQMYLIFSIAGLNEKRITKIFAKSRQLRTTRSSARTEVLVDGRVQYIRF